MNNLVRNKEIIYRFHLTKIDTRGGVETLFYKGFYHILKE